MLLLHVSERADPSLPWSPVVAIVTVCQLPWWHWFWNSVVTIATSHEMCSGDRNDASHLYDITGQSCTAAHRWSLIRPFIRFSFVSANSISMVTGASNNTATTWWGGPLDVVSTRIKTNKDTLDYNWSINLNHRMWVFWQPSCLWFGTSKGSIRVRDCKAKYWFMKPGHTIQCDRGSPNQTEPVQTSSD